MTAMSEDRVVINEITCARQWVMRLTGYTVAADPSLGRVGVEIDHDARLIKINAYLDPPAYRWALSRAYRRIAEGALAAPEFRTKLRLVGLD